MKFNTRIGKVTAWLLAILILPLLALCIYRANATAYDLRVGSTDGDIIAGPIGKMQTVIIPVSFDDQSTTVSDTISVLFIPKGTYVFGVALIVDTPEGATNNIDVGDGATADGYLDGTDVEGSLNPTAGTITWSRDGGEGFALGKMYLADDSLKVTCNSAGGDTAEFRLCVTLASIVPPAPAN